MATHRVLYLLITVTVVAVAACASPNAVPTIIPGPVALNEKVDVGGYALRIVCIGEGTPAVIFESGFGQSGVESNVWIAVTSEIRKSARVCTYDRTGLGTSDPPPGEVRTSKDIAKDLHTLLVNAKVPAPYILVGHSLGGYHIRVFASLYPDEVVGMVLVDAFHPDQWSEIAAVLPPKSPNESEILKEYRTVPDTNNLEKLDFLASAAQVREAGSLGDLPLEVLTQCPTCTWYADPGLPPAVSEKIEGVWQKLQNDLAGLSSNSMHVVATKAGHFIQLDEPRLVIDAILRVLEKAKKRGP